MTSLILYSIISFQRKKKTSKQAAELLPSFVSKHRDEEIMARTGCCPAAPTSQLYTQSFSLSLSSSLYTHTLLCTVLCVYYTSVSPPPFFETKKLASNTGIYECVWRGSGLAEFPHVLSTWGHPLDKSYDLTFSFFPPNRWDTHCVLFSVQSLGLLMVKNYSTFFKGLGKVKKRNGEDRNISDRLFGMWVIPVCALDGSLPLISTPT